MILNQLKCSKFIRLKRRRLVAHHHSLFFTNYNMPACYLLSSKFILTFACILLVYFFTMDIILFNKIKQRSPLKPFNHSIATTVGNQKQNYFGGWWSPLTIKKIMIVDSTHYIRSPLAEFVETFLSFSRVFPFLTANVISLFHCLLSLICVRYLIHDSLFWRQCGVILFQFRNWLDSFDGVIYRAHASSSSSHDYKSHYGSLG